MGSKDDKLNHMMYVPVVVQDDLVQIQAKEDEYQGSWKKRGGVGAFMMLARKWDRLENVWSRIEDETQKHTYDIFDAMSKDQREEGILDDIRDLRRYLILVEAEHLRRMTNG